MLCLMLFFGLMSGLTYNLSTYRSNVLNSINIPAQYFGVIFAIIQIMAGGCSKAQGWLHRKFGLCYYLVHRSSGRTGLSGKL